MAGGHVEVRQIGASVRAEDQNLGSLQAGTMRRPLIARACKGLRAVVALLCIASVLALGAPVLRDAGVQDLGEEALGVPPRMTGTQAHEKQADTTKTGEALEARDVHTSLSNDRLSLTVSFSHDGKEHTYNLYATSVFAIGGKVIEHNDNETLVLQPSASSLFRCDMVGRRASARLHNDGSVTGLFQNDDRVVRMRPSPSRDESRMGRTQHHVHYFSPPSFLHGHAGGAHTVKRELRGARPALSVQTGRRLEETPRIADDRDAVFERVSDMPEDEVPSSTGPAIKALTNWGGVRWWPGCYDGDSSLHDFHISMYLDNAAWTKHSNDVESHVEDAVREASLIFEMQMNVRWVIDELVIYKSTSNAPSWAVGCPSSSDVVTPKLNAFTEDRDMNFAAAHHLLTGCGTDYGSVGLAYIGTICNAQYAKGVSQIHDRGYEDTFLTLAHEVGHNFGADHSFEEGQGKTGGIMDYGDGHLQGVYQFNTKYRKAEMCGKISRVVNKCSGKFTKSGAPTPTPAPQPTTTSAPATTTPRPTPRPTPGPTPRPTPSPSPSTTAAPAPSTTPPPGEACVTTGTVGEGRGHECAFPFVYNDVEYHGCSTDDHHTVWCATEVDDKNNYIAGKWAECSWSAPCLGQDAPCYTAGDAGAGAGLACVFPFVSHGREFSTCTNLFHHTPWCATKVDEDMNMVEWAECEKTDYCQSHWKTMGWLGIPYEFIANFGNQAVNKWQEMLDSAAEETSSWWQNFVNWLKNLWPFSDNKEEETTPEVAKNLWIGQWSATGPLAHAGVPVWCVALAGIAAFILVGALLAVAVRRRRQARAAQALAKEDEEDQARLIE